jgi:uncharacterized cupredoxin-like copper-binding protein
MATPAVAQQAMQPDGHDHGAEIGEPGKPEAVMLTLQVKLGDTFFTPTSLRVRPGQTVRLVLTNEGQLLHEFTLGTPEMNAEHQKEMLAMAEQGLLTPTGIDEVKMMHAMMGHGAPGASPVMMHDHPNSVLVKPGERKELIWKFPRDAVLEFACNLPGHYQAGMVGDVQFNR